MTKPNTTPSPKSSKPVLKQTELTLLTVRTGEAPRPEIVISWDPLAEGEFDPNTRYPEMCVGDGKDKQRLHEYLHTKINLAIRRWHKLADKPESVAEALRIKDSCMAAIVNAHSKVLTPGMDRSALSHATALCANAIRTVTVLCNYVLDWPDSAMSNTPTAQKERIFALSRFFAGMRSFSEAQLSREMLPFGSKCRLNPIKRESSGDRDPKFPDKVDPRFKDGIDARLLANIFAGSAEEVKAGYLKTLARLQAPAKDAHLTPGSDGSDEEGEVEFAGAENYSYAR